MGDAAIEVGNDASGPTVDPAEVAKFRAMADAWWDPAGKFRPLHRLNPVRIAYLRERAVEHFGRDAKSLRPLAGLRLLDIGCGGGLLAEPMTRLGAEVVGIDAAGRNIAAAMLHAATSRLRIDYRMTTAEELAATGARFDVVLNMEVVEHVADPAVFLESSIRLLAPGGMMVLATLNRTAKSFALAIVGAEYLLGWLPRGTHDWRRFLRPSELARLLRPHRAAIVDLVGVSYNPLADEWRVGRDLDVNYMATVTVAERHG